MVLKTFIFILIFLSYHWKDYVVTENIPKDAVEAGKEKDGSPIYIGRTMYQNELQTVTFYSTDKKAYISYSGQVIQVYEFQILLNYLPDIAPIWSTSGFGNLPKNAVECGFNTATAPCYVARVFRDGVEHPGKYWPYLDACHYVNGTSEGRANDCDVLVNRIDGYDWIATTKNSIPKDYFVVSKDDQDRDVAVGYTYYEDERTLVKITPSAGTASITMNGKEIALEDQVIHVLVQHVHEKSKPFEWHFVQKGADYSNKDIVQVGYTHDGRVLHVGRYLRDGVYIPGKVIRYDHKICIPFNGVEEVHTGDFEVLYLRTLKEV